MSDKTCDNCACKPTCILTDTDQMGSDTHCDDWTPKYDDLFVEVEDLTSRLESSEALRKDAYRAMEEAQAERDRLRGLLEDVTLVFSQSPRMTPLQRTSMEHIRSALVATGGDS